MARWVSTAQLSIQKSILSAAAKGDAKAILQLVAEGQLSAVSVSTAAHRLAKLRGAQVRHGTVQQLQGPILKAQGEFGAQATANTIWALAKLSCKEDLLWSSLSHRASQQLSEFTGRHLANLSWSLATSSMTEGSHSSALLGRLSYEVMRKAETKELTPQSLANVLWSFAVLAMWDSQTMLAPVEAVAGYAEAFNARDLSNTLWALSLYKGSSTEGLDWKKLLIALARSAKFKAHDLHPNDLTAIAWAFVDATPLQLHWLNKGRLNDSYEALD